MKHVELMDAIIDEIAERVVKKLREDSYEDDIAVEHMMYDVPPPVAPPAPPEQVNIPDVSGPPEPEPVDHMTLTEFKGYAIENSSQELKDRLRAMNAEKAHDKAKTFEQLQEFEFNDSMDYIIARVNRHYFICSLPLERAKCPQTHDDGRQCQRDAGHEGKHYYGKKEVEIKEPAADDIGQKYGQHNIPLWKVIDYCRAKGLMGITQTLEDNENAMEYATDNFDQIVKDLTNA